MIAGANIASVIVMLLVGFSDRINPSDFSLFSTLGMAFPIFVIINLAFLLFWLIFKWRMAWIPIVGFILAYVPISIYMPLNPSQSVPDGALKLLSYNVCSYGGNFLKYEDCFTKVLEYVTQESPDIVCLQEDVDSWRGNVFKKYAEQGLVYNDTAVLSNNPLSFNALGIHTRYPIIHRERISFPSLNNGSVAWWLKVNGDTLIVVNNHLESCHLSLADRRQYRQIIHGEMSSDSARRESKLLLVKLADANAKRSGQIRAVREYALKHSQYPVIVCGDFNDTPISYSRHTMADSLTDCFVTTGRGIGLSYNQKAFSFRIDHVFCNEGVTPYNCVIDNKMDASDHNPLTCWLKISTKH